MRDLLFRVPILGLKVQSLGLCLRCRGRITIGIFVV